MEIVILPQEIVIAGTIMEHPMDLVVRGHEEIVVII